jgi:hypothetical protein
MTKRPPSSHLAHPAASERARTFSAFPLASDAVPRDPSPCHRIAGLPGDGPRSGFSSLQVFAALATVAILAAIAKPSECGPLSSAPILAREIHDEYRELRSAIASYHVDNDAYPRMTWNAAYRDVAVPSWLEKGDPRVAIASHGALAFSRPRDARGEPFAAGAWGCVAEPIAYATTEADRGTPLVEPIDEEDVIPDPIPQTAGRYVYFNAEQYWELRERLGDRFQERHVFKPKDRAEIDAFIAAHGAWILWHPGPGGYAEYEASGRGPFVAYDPTNGSTSKGSFFQDALHRASWYYTEMQPGDGELFLRR